ncbi:hypothetical protein [Psychroserpens algicola]|uniref:Uncharacterized protein n=1 Tax=Psychroserpens algicola TaxID=1719034 RepID=A0ABT0H9A2_9FLAO|nr:hypothetical protein [Psychroserpens algicola]MCK8480950.1 hypothetical protein [Psychroserpens algicola]
MNDESYVRFGELLYKKYILPKHLNIASRQVTYWKSKHILPYFDDQKHGKMNIPQAIWMAIIKELSDIGIDSKRLAILSKDVWFQPKEDKYADDVIKKNLKSKRSGLSTSAKAVLESQLSDDILMDTLRKELNPFTDMLKSCLMNSKEPHSIIYIPNTGEHHFLQNNNEILVKLNSLYSNDSIICIPILGKLSKVVSFDLNSPEKNLKYLSDIENQIRDIVIFKRPKIVEIAFDDNHIKPRVITEKHIKQDEIADFFLKNKIPKGTKLLIDVRSQDNYKLTLITK